MFPFARKRCSQSGSGLVLGPHHLRHTFFPERARGVWGLRVPSVSPDERRSPRDGYITLSVFTAASTLRQSRPLSGSGRRGPAWTAGQGFQYPLARVRRGVAHLAYKDVCRRARRLRHADRPRSQTACLSVALYSLPFPGSSLAVHLCSLRRRVLSLLVRKTAIGI